MNKKVYVEGTEQDKQVLSKFIKTSEDRRAIQRAQAILWSIEGRDRTDLAGLFHVKTDTISGWFKRWHPDDLSTLSDEQRKGRPPLLTEEKKKRF